MNMKRVGFLGMILVYCILSPLTTGAELSEVQRELKKDIERAQKELSSTEASISRKGKNWHAVSILHRIEYWT